MTGKHPIIKVAATDIIKLGKKGRVDCIVNPANRELAEGGTLCGKIYNAAASNHLDDDLRGVLGISEGGALLQWDTAFAHSSSTHLPLGLRMNQSGLNTVIVMCTF